MIIQNEDVIAAGSVRAGGKARTRLEDRYAHAVLPTRQQKLEYNGLWKQKIKQVAFNALQSLCPISDTLVV
jgi:hypothetical protein